MEEEGNIIVMHYSLHAHFKSSNYYDSELVRKLSEFVLIKFILESEGKFSEFPILIKEWLAYLNSSIFYW